MSMWFWFAFPWWLVMLSIFPFTCWPFACLLWKNVYSVPLPIFKGLFEFFNSLYILDINPLSGIWFADIFSHSVGCFFILLILLLLCRSVLVWRSPTYEIFALVVLFLCFWCHHQKNHSQDKCAFLGLHTLLWGSNRGGGDRPTPCPRCFNSKTETGKEKEDL